MSEAPKSQNPTFTMTPIGVVHSCFEEKFAVPRQPGLVPSATGSIELLEPFNHPDIVDGLENCTHIWVQFVFHECVDRGWQMKVRPPRLGGNKKMGVFATRATHRPNSLGLSVVKLERIETRHQKVVLHIQGQDLVEGTPVLDIKPYIPYADIVEQAEYPFAQHEPEKLKVTFSPKADSQLQAVEEERSLRTLIIEVLQQDPKPAFHKPDQEREYGAKLSGKNVKWRYLEDIIEVTAID